jgi:MFS family permease
MSDEATPAPVAAEAPGGPAPAAAPRGMATFYAVWLAQLVSAVGTGLTGFVLSVWVWERTASPTQFALFNVLAILTIMAVSPLGGALADRLDRRRLLIATDCAAALVTLVLAWGLAAGWLALAHLYPLVVLLVGANALQAPAALAAVTQLAPRAKLGRASGLAQASQAASQVVSPLLAGTLAALVGYGGVVMIDVATFLVAVAVLLAVRFPPLERGDAPPGGAGRPATARGEAWRFIRERPGLLALLGLFVLASASLGMVQVLLTPLILSFGPITALAAVNSAAAVGAIAGTVALGVWGGPRRKVRGILGALLLQGSILFLGGVKPSVPLIAGAAFVFMLAGPVAAGASQAIWQSKVPATLQGRVFGLRQAAAAAAMPVAILAAGPLAERVFEPLLAAGGPLAGSVGRLIGVGPGRGVGLLVIGIGAVVVAGVLFAASHRRLRQVESELPDAV